MGVHGKVESDIGAEITVDQGRRELLQSEDNTRERDCDAATAIKSRGNMQMQNAELVERHRQLRQAQEIPAPGLDEVTASPMSRKQEEANMPDSPESLQASTRADDEVSVRAKGTPGTEPALEYRQRTNPSETDTTAGTSVQRERKSLNARKPEVSKHATRLFVIGYLTLFAILGTLARLGLQALTTYAQAPVSQGLVWANFAGSFVMGYLSYEQKLFREEWGTLDAKDSHAEKLDEAYKAAEKKRHGSVKKTIPLFIGLTTGFCGSLTSFSSFQRDVFLALANSAPSPDRSHIIPRSGGHSFLALLASLITTPCLSLAALSAGAHLAIFTDHYTPTLSFRVVRGLVDPVLTLIGLGAWFGAIVMAIWPPDRPQGSVMDGSHGWDRETWRGEAIFALVFAPLGAIARFYVSLWLNPRIASFPLGTFTVNVFGTLMETLLYDLQHAPLMDAAVGGGMVGCQVLQGLQDGFCGCLTTVSTWVLELKTLRRAHAYLYGLVSLLVGLGTTTIVMGSLRWTRGFAAPACIT